LILQALYDHYQRLLDDPGSNIAPPGYSPAKVSHVLVIDTDGKLLDILAIVSLQGKKYLPKTLLVPEQVKRTSGIAANILCDNVSYMLGIEQTKQGEIVLTMDKYNKFKSENEKFLHSLNSEEVFAVLAFLKKWNPEKALSHPIVMPRINELFSGSNMVFKLDGKLGYIHENAEIRNAWDNRLHSSSDDIIGQCLITGDVKPIARLHPSIKGIIGAQTSGASLVSFNADSFTSYGKSQSFNSPVSQNAAFAYGTALNYLIASDTNHIRLSDTTMVFWAEKQGKIEETVLSWCLDPVEIGDEKEDEKRHIDFTAARQAKTILERVKKGLTVGDPSFDANTNCYLLGLAPNAARLSVRFWQVSNFGDLLKRIAKHYKDMDIVGLERIGGFVSPWRMLKAIAVLEDAKNIPPLLGGQVLQAILTGQMYPQTLYNLTLLRCRAGGEHGGVTTIRASIIKAFLLRKYRIQNQHKKEVLITMGLNKDNVETAYLLGRLFSILEKTQKDALGSNINATIRDRYFGAASATPGSVFPLLLRLSRHHIAKSDYGNVADRKIQEVMNHLTAFPSHLNMEDQGQFILGYYHQNQANYEKNEGTEG